MTPLMSLLRAVGRFAYSPFTPEAFFKAAVRFLARFLRWTRIAPNASLPSMGSLGYDIMMEVYFAIMFAVVTLTYWVLLPGTADFVISCFTWKNLLMVVALMVVGLRIWEMSVRKIRAGLSGIPRHEDSVLRRGRLFVISVVHAGEMVVFLSILKLVTLWVAHARGLSLASLYSSSGAVRNLKSQLFYRTIATVTPAGSSDLTPLHWSTQGLTILDAIAGLGIALAFFNMLFSRQES